MSLSRLVLHALTLTSVNSLCLQTVIHVYLAYIWRDK